jgi:hypothetical protein
MKVGAWNGATCGRAEINSVCHTVRVCVTCVPSGSYSSWFFNELGTLSELDNTVIFLSPKFRECRSRDFRYLMVLVSLFLTGKRSR